MYTNSDNTFQFSRYTQYPKNQKLYFLTCRTVIYSGTRINFKLHSIIINEELLLSGAL